MSVPAPIFSVRQLVVSVEAHTIVTGLDLDLAPGSVHALMGPNGSGKSTLANALAGHPQYVAKAKKLELNGTDIRTATPDERAKLGLFLAFQHPVEVPGVRVLNFLWEAYKLRFATEKRTPTTIVQFRDHLRELGKSLGLDDAFLMRGLNENFSGGEKKRLEVLQLLALQPSVAILDETDSGLDVDAIRLVAAGVQRAVSEFHTAVLVITHYQRILEYLKPDVVHIMVAGKLEKTGGTELIAEIESAGYASYLPKKTEKSA